MLNITKMKKILKNRVIVTCIEDDLLITDSYRVYKNKKSLYDPKFKEAIAGKMLKIPENGETFQIFQRGEDPKRLDMDIASFIKGDYKIQCEITELLYKDFRVVKIGKKVAFFDNDFIECIKNYKEYDVFALHEDAYSMIRLSNGDEEYYVLPIRMPHGVEEIKNILETVE